MPLLRHTVHSLYCENAIFANVERKLYPRGRVHDQINRVLASGYPTALTGSWTRKHQHCTGSMSDATSPEDALAATKERLF